MKCEECLLTLDEYACGELAESARPHLETHLADCAACASEHAQLQRERELYARCAGKAPPTLWAALQTKVREEKMARASSPVARIQAWLAGAFGGRLPRRLAVAALIIFGVCVGVIKYVAWRGGPTGAAEVRAGSEDLPPTAPPAPSVPSEQERGGGRVRAPAGPRDVTMVRRANRHPGAGAADVRARPDGTAGGKSAAGGSAIAVGDSPTGAAVGDFGPGAGGAGAQWRFATDPDLDAETSRHIERAQMLLRSFNNAQLASDAYSADIAYERRSSRELLGRNLLLRNDARAEGNEVVERLLSQLEPFLLDIANLQENSSRQQVELIKEQMRRKGIIASLSLF